MWLTRVFSCPTKKKNVHCMLTSSVLCILLCHDSGPEKVEGDLPSYPGFEKDVFGVVRDYFMGLPEPLITYELYDVIINVFGQH